MCSGVDLRVHSQRNWRSPSQAGGDARDALELGLRLDVQAADAAFQRQLYFRLALANAGEKRLRRFAAGSHHTRELAARDDVEAGAEACEQREHREVGVRLD